MYVQAREQQKEPKVRADEKNITINSRILLDSRATCGHSLPRARPQSARLYLAGVHFTYTRAWFRDLTNGKEAKEYTTAAVTAEARCVPLLSPSIGVRAVLAWSYVASCVMDTTMARDTAVHGSGR